MPLRFLLGFVLLGLCKLWLVSGDEIVARDASLDQLRFAEMAQSLIEHRWLGDYDWLTLYRPPGYPIWISWVYSAGIRYRVGIELLLIASACGFASAMREYRYPPLLCLGLFVLIVFEPLTLLWNSELRAETFYGPMLVLFVSGAIALWIASGELRRLGWSLVTAVAFASCWQSRLEHPPLVLYLSTAVLFTFVVVRRSGGGWWTALRRGAELLFVPVFLVVVSNLAIERLNAATYGVSAVTELQAPGFLAAYHELLSVSPDSPRHFVSVTRDMRDKAYVVSPAFRELQPHLEGETAKKWIAASCEISHVCDDIANGWFLYALREAAAAAGHHQSAPEAERFYAQVASELEAAVRDDRLPVRRVLADFLEPSVTVYWSRLPDSFRRVMGMFADPVGEVTPEDALDRPWVHEIFDAVSRRHPRATGDEPVTIQGWVVGIGDQVERVELRDDGGAVVAVTQGLGERPDVVSYLTREGMTAVPVENAFWLQARGKAAEANALRASFLAFIRSGGDETLFPLSTRHGRTESVLWHTEAISKRNPPIDAAARAQSLIRSFPPVLVTGLSVAAIASLVILIVFGGRAWLTGPPFLVIALLGVVIGARVALLALIDASSFPATDSRYVLPVAALYNCAAVLLIYHALEATRRSGRFGRLWLPFP